MAASRHAAARPYEASRRSRCCAASAQPTAAAVAAAAAAVAEADALEQAKAGGSEGGGSGAAGPSKASEAAAVPDQYICSITAEMMTDPVIAADGHTYERRAIEAWFSRARTSPVTNEPLEHLHLIPAHTIRSLIQRRFEAP